MESAVVTCVIEDVVLSKDPLTIHVSVIEAVEYGDIRLVGCPVNCVWLHHGMIASSAGQKLLYLSLNTVWGTSEN